MDLIWNIIIKNLAYKIFSLLEFNTLIGETQKDN